MQSAAAAAHAFVVTTQAYQDCKPFVASLWETTKKVLSDAVRFALKEAGFLCVTYMHVCLQGSHPCNILSIAIGPGPAAYFVA